MKWDSGWHLYPLEDFFCLLLLTWLYLAKVLSSDLKEIITWALRKKTLYWFETCYLSACDRGVSSWTWSVSAVNQDTGRAWHWSSQDSSQPVTELWLFDTRKTMWIVVFEKLSWNVCKTNDLWIGQIVKVFSSAVNQSLHKGALHFTVADSSLQSLHVVAEDENKCTQTRTVWWRKRDGTGTLLWWQSYSHFAQGDSTLSTLSRGEHPNPCLGRLSLFFLGPIIYYIECCCPHFRYNQGNENKKCRWERWWANYAPSLGKFIQALEITLKIGNKHLLFQTRVREF